jgi:hypothetical protein
MLYCSQCKSQISEGDNYCRSCGAEIQRKQTSKLAWASAALGLLSMAVFYLFIVVRVPLPQIFKSILDDFFYLLPLIGVAAIAVSIFALRRIKRRNNIKGVPIVIVGICGGGLFLFISMIFLVLILVLRSL